MVDREDEPKDQFENFRSLDDGLSYLPWETWSQRLLHYYPDQTIPPDESDHLREWYVIRNLVQRGEMPVQQFNELTTQFGDEHDSLYSTSSTFALSIAEITNSFPVVV